MKKIIELYNKKDLLSCEVYQINKTSKQKLFEIETQKGIETFVKNTTKNNWGLVNQFIEFNYLNNESILIKI